MGREVTNSFVFDGAIHDNEFFIETLDSSATIHGPSHLLTEDRGGYRCNNVVHGAVIGTLTKESNAISFSNEIHLPVNIGAYAKGTSDGAKFFDEEIYVDDGDVRVEQATDSNAIITENAEFYRTSVICVGDKVLTNTDGISALLTIGSGGDASTAVSYGMKISGAITLPPVAAKISGVNYDTLADWNAETEADAEVGTNKTNLIIQGVPSEQSGVLFRSISDLGNKKYTLYNQTIPADGLLEIHLPISDDTAIGYRAEKGSTAGVIGGSTESSE